MPYNDDENHSPSEFYYPEQTNDPNKYGWTFSSESVFCSFLQSHNKLQSKQSHIINPLLTSFARSVRESIAFGFYRTDLAPSSLGLYEKPQAILSRTDLALGYYIVLNI